MAEQTHQTPPAAPADTPEIKENAVVQPRSEQQPADPPEVAAAKLKNLEGFWNRVAPKPEKKGAAVAEKPAKPAEAQTPQAPPTQAVEPEKTKSRRREKKPEIDPIQIAEATGRAVAQEFAKAQPRVETAPPAPTPEPELPEEFKQSAEVFEEMARLEPSKYAKLKGQFAKYYSAEDEYIRNWEKEHPGETFNGDSDEHDAFYTGIRPDYSQRDFERAKESLIEQRVTRKTEERLQSQMAQIEKRREQLATIKPELDGEMVALLGEMASESDPHHAELAKQGWPGIQKIEQENPLLWDVMTNVHNGTKPILEASMRLYRGIDQFDQKNSTHGRVAAFVGEAEKHVLSLPIKDRYDNDGRRLFATQDDYSKMSRADQVKHWYVDEQNLAAYIRGRAIRDTKTGYEAELKRLSRYNKVVSPSPSTMPATPKPAEQTPPAKADNGSPSVSGRGTLPGSAQQPDNGSKSGKDWFWDRYLGR